MSFDINDPAGSAGTPETGGEPPSHERALVLVPVFKAPGGRRDSAARGPEARVEEAIGLARAIDLDVVEAFHVSLASFQPATLFGSGKVKELSALVADKKIGLVVVDHALSPVQQRNLEKELKAKVIDRTGLILEIFGERARTREGTLQVELAHLNYQKSRLVRSWTHLERQRGGFGFLGGPGETQIEADRRALGDRIDRIERELLTVATRRRLQRENRRRSAIPVVALVGYTNAGKSTLFNALTRANILAEDKLFATLDPTLRQIELPHGGIAVLSDTVGFVADLPTTLVAAFRATLEEVTEADLILHVRDIAHPDTDAQSQDVAAVLDDLGIDINEPRRCIEVWNKIDLLDAVGPTTRFAGDDSPNVVAISAMTGEGLDALLDVIEQRISSGRHIFQVELAGSTLANLHRLYEYGEVLRREDSADGSTIAEVRVRESSLERFTRSFPNARKATER